jgi:hypothetical protein
MSYQVDAVRGLVVSEKLATIPIDLATVAIYDAVMFIVASASFKRIVE